MRITMLCIWIMLLPFFGWSQANPARVLSKEGKPLGGATIRFLAHKEIIVADLNGVFNLPLQNLPDTIVIAHIGYREIRQWLPLDVKLPAEWTMEELVQTSEVIVNTGYQKLPKERATGSFTLVDKAMLDQQVGTNIFDRLESIANGYTVSRENNRNGQMMIRGLSTIQGPKDPLIVVDNFPYNGSLDNINPSDVESVTFLKDAAAASIWGSKAANGVIVVTTRKARFNTPLQVGFTANFTAQAMPRIMDYQRINSTDFIDVEQMLFSKGYRFSDTSSNAKPPFSPVYEILFKQRRGQLTPAQATAMIDAYRQHDTRTDFQNQVYRTGLNQQYALNLQGGSPNFNWMMTGGYDQNVSDLSATYKRITLRSENTLRITKKLTMTAGLSLVSSSTNTGRPGYGDISTVKGSIPPYTYLSNPDGSPVALAKDYRESYTDTAGAGKLLNWKYYPLTDYLNTVNPSKLTSLVATIGLNYQALRTLNLSLQYQYEGQQVEGRKLQDMNAYFSRDMINRFSQLNRATGVVTYKVPAGGIMDITNTRLEGSSARATASIQESWGVDHQLSALAGAEIRDIRNRSNNYRVYGYDDDILTVGNVDFANTYPSFVTGSSSLIPMASSLNSTTNRFVSLFANAAYTFRGRYTLSGSVRRDASNNFGVETNDRWTPLWSAGAGWELSKEKWMSGSTFSLLKMRTTYGLSGNVDPSKSALTTINYTVVSPYTLSAQATIDKFYNPDLRWEKTAMWNLGLDFRLAHDRISGSVEYYRKKGDDLYGASVVDYTVGLGSATVVKNVAAMKGQGVDFEINTVNTTGIVGWQTQFILNYSTDEIVEYYLANQQGNQFIGGTFTPIVGSPVYGFYAYRWAGLDPANGDPIGYLNGQPSRSFSTLIGPTVQVSDLAYIGRTMPSVYGSLGNTISWKGLSLSFRFAYKFGYYFKRKSINYGALYAASTGHPDYALRWQNPGDEQYTQVPSMVYPAVASRDAFYNGSEILAEKGDHIRLQYITLQYQLTKRIGKLPFKDLSIYSVLHNVGIIWRANDRNLDAGYQDEFVSPPMNLSFGIRSHF
jgi:TonB-linked SusC/RagA family outer membrane protein